MNDYSDIIARAAALRQHLHEIPEPALSETRTKKALMDFLADNTALKIVDRGAWFYALWDGGNALPPIAFRADFDAVPAADGAAHLCGHDGHSAILAGTAMALERVRPVRRVYLLFQPGEETGQGALLCRQLLREEPISAIYGLHNIPGYPAGHILVRDGTFACASTGMEITVAGTPAHAAYPEQGKNPAALLSSLVLQVNDYVNRKHDGIVLATVIGLSVGGRSFGVSASQGVLRLTLRAEHPHEYEDLLAFVRRTAQDAAERAGMDCAFTIVEPFPATVGEAACVDRVRDAAGRAGLKITELSEPMRWSEDFGHYLAEIPGAFFGLGAGETCPGLHTASYVFPDEILQAGVRMFTALAEL